MQIRLFSGPLATMLRGIPVLAKHTVWLSLLVFFLTLTGTLSAGAQAVSATEPSAAPGWKAISRDGVFWLQKPDGSLFYSKGVNNVNGSKESPRSLVREAYCWNNFYPTMNDWRCDVGARLESWGFNTCGGWSDGSPDMNLYLTVNLDLGRRSMFHWGDPLGPDMFDKMVEVAEKATAPYRNNPRIIGYFSDNEVGWWNSPLFEWYLKDPWTSHTKQALWGLLYETYGGDWDRFLADWVPRKDLRSFEDLKQKGAAMQLRPGGNGIRVVDRFMTMVVSRYYELAYKAIHQVHPGALVLGDRLPLYYHQDAVLAMRGNIDVISTNYNVDEADGWVAPYYFEGLRRLTGKPVLVTEFFFASDENRSGNLNQNENTRFPKPRHFTTVDTQVQRAWGVSNAIANFARFPNIVGTHWFQYWDEPKGGRDDGEDYNLGLVDTSNRPYESLVEMFSTHNPVLNAIHAGSAPGAHAGDAEGGCDPRAHCGPKIVRAHYDISVSDQSFLDWDERATRIDSFTAPSPYVPFGDVHLAWSPEGIYLAAIANTYVEPRFLAYEGSYPLSDVFKIDLAVGPDSRRQFITIYLVPEANPNLFDGFELVPIMTRHHKGEEPVKVPVEGHVEWLHKSLPHVRMEAFIPAEWFAEGKLKQGMTVPVDITVTSFYREFSMNWKAEPVLAPDPAATAIQQAETAGPPPANN